LSAISSFDQLTDNTPAQVGALPKDTGHVTRTANGVVYFDGLKQIPDPVIGSLTPLQTLNQRSTLKAITDSSGTLVAINPSPGTIGSMSQSFLEGPGSFRL